MADRCDTRGRPPPAHSRLRGTPPRTSSPALLPQTPECGTQRPRASPASTPADPSHLPPFLPATPRGTRRPRIFLIRSWTSLAGDLLQGPPSTLVGRSPLEQTAPSPGHYSPRSPSITPEPTPLQRLCLPLPLAVPPSGWVASEASLHLTYRSFSTCQTDDNPVSSRTFRFVKRPNSARHLGPCWCMNSSDILRLGP